MLFPHSQFINQTFLSQNHTLPVATLATNQGQQPYLSQQEFNIHQLVKDHSLMSSDFDHPDRCSALKVSTNTVENSKSTQIEEEEDEEVEESYNAEDFTNRSYTYPEYKEYLEISQENDQQIARCRGQTSFQFSTDSNEGISSQQYIYLAVPRILKQSFESHLYGDIILESDYSNFEEKSVNSFCNWKLLSQIQKFSSYVKMHAQDITQSSENFIAAIQICMQHSQKEVFDLAALFTQFSRIFNFIKTGFAKMAEYIEIFSKHDQLMQRHRLFEELSDKYLANIPAQSVFFAVKLGPNFKSHQIETRSICFSNALFKLCCVDVDQFISLSLKGKSPEFFGWQARIMFLRHKLLSFLRQEHFQNGEIIDILTRDGMRVPVRSRREKVTFDLDKQLPGLELGQLSEIMVVYYFDVDPTMQSQIDFLRQNHTIDGFDNQDQSDFHTYSLETQAFLDLYYSQYKPVSKSMKKKHHPQTITQ